MVFKYHQYDDLVVNIFMFCLNVRSSNFTKNIELDGFDLVKLKVNSFVCW